MDIFAEISGWFQLACLVGMLILAQKRAQRFKGLKEWRRAWISFAIGFFGMFESRIFVILFAYKIEYAWMTWTARFVSPLQAILGLFLGMLFFELMDRKMEAIGETIRLPTPARFAIDQQNIVTEWDAEAEDLFGWTAAEAIGLDLAERISPPRLRWHHTPIAARHQQEIAKGILRQSYTLTVLARHTPPEFSVEVVLTAEPLEDGSLLFKGVAGRFISTLPNALKTSGETTRL